MHRFWASFLCSPSWTVWNCWNCCWNFFFYIFRSLLSCLFVLVVAAFLQKLFNLLPKQPGDRVSGVTTLIIRRIELLCQVGGWFPENQTSQHIFVHLSRKLLILLIDLLKTAGGSGIWIIGEPLCWEGYYMPTVTEVTVVGKKRSFKCE